MSDNTQKTANSGLRPYMTPAGAWALSIGTAIGWGSLVITSSTYLSQAGPLGSTLGLVIGALIMLVIAQNYHYLINCFPEAGGAYTYAKEAFGYDHGFLTAWFLALTYLAVFWANATSLPLFARYFLGGIFRVGYLYTIFGYDVYIGEVLMVMAAIILTALLLSKSRSLLQALLIGMAAFFTIGITVCFAAAVIRHGTVGASMEPMVVPDRSAVSQVIRIACISPWAFIGFENISHLTEEYSFSRDRALRILRIAVISTTLLYIFIILLSATAYPPEYASWLEYIRDLGSNDGIRGLPAFYAAYTYMGNTGIMILIFSLLALIITSLIGNTLALSRLLYALAKDEVIPVRFSELNRSYAPGNAIWLMAGVSLLIPFLGRTAIGWIVDVTTIGATIVYAFVCASAWKTAKDCGDKKEQMPGFFGLLLMVFFLLFLLLPNLFSEGTMERESYILFTVWAIAGFIYFRNLLKNDRSRRFGKSIIVWIGLLSLVLFTSLVWMSQSMVAATGRAMNDVMGYYSGMLGEGEQAVAAAAFMEQELRRLQMTNARSMLIVICMFGFSLMTLLNIYSLMKKRAEESEAELGTVRRMAGTDPLTGVKSKHAYAEKERELDEQIQCGDAEAFSVVVCDVNGLKYVNDTFGHKAGDEYIRSASIMICELYTHSPVFRTGGDEFVVILTGRDHANREAILKELKDRSESRIGTDEAVVAAGMADFLPDSDTGLHMVFDRADAKMYENKKALKEMGARSR